MAKLTKKRVEGIKPGTKDIFEWDTELRGFGVRVKPSGQRSYLIQYRNIQSRSRRMTLGTHGRLTTEQARKEARQLLASVELGKDPASAKSAIQGVPTFEEFAKQYMEDYAPGRKKESSIKTDEINLRCHVLPRFGHLNITDISRNDVVKRS